MFYHLLQRPFRTPFLLLIISIPLFYWIDMLIEWMVSTTTDVSFHYQEPAHLKLIYLVLGVVFIGLSNAINRSENPDHSTIEKSLIRWCATFITAFLIGNLIHFWMLCDIITNRESMMAFEDNFWLYYLPDYLLVISFSVGGFFWVRPLIHQN